MAKAIQVHMKTPANTSQEYGVSEVHQMTWVPTTLKASKGMVIETKGDSRPWTVVAAYSIPAEIPGLADWTVVGQI